MSSIKIFIFFKKLVSGVKCSDRHLYTLRSDRPDNSGAHLNNTTHSDYNIFDYVPCALFHIPVTVLQLVICV